MKQAPDCCIPKWAHMYGVKMNVIEAHCGNYNANDKLPRGCDKRIAGLRVRIIHKIRQPTMTHLKGRY